VSSVKELIALREEESGKLNFATSGNGSAPHLAAVLFERLAGVDMVHVPLQGRRARGAVGARRRHAAFVRHAAVGAAAGAGGPAARARRDEPRATPLVPACREWPRRACPTTNLVLVRVLRAGGNAAEVVRKLFDATSQALKLPEIARMLAREGPKRGLGFARGYAAFLEPMRSYGRASSRKGT
jgi:tripartite-type tricarboxylate transporter receptor subunit TctC